MENQNLPKTTEPEIIVERYDDSPKEPKPSGFFSELNTDGASNKKLFAIVGGVLGVAMITIFMIDAFMLGPSESDKHLDLSKQLTPSPKEEKEEVAGTETNEMSEKPQEKNTNTSAGTFKKPTATKAPVPTAAPTNKPDPTATPQPQPTATLPVPTSTIAAPTTVTPTDITPIP